MEDGSSVDSAISGDDAGILPTPGYMEMVKRVAEVQWRLVSNIPTGFSYYEQLKTYCHYTWFDASLILGFAVLWTILRSSLTSNVYKPILNRLQLDDKQNVVKAPESMFKSFWYLFSWSYTYYVLFNGKYDIFQNPAAIFEELVDTSGVKGSYYLQTEAEWINTDCDVTSIMFTEVHMIGFSVKLVLRDHLYIKSTCLQ
uniref:Ceramide synthase 1-like n=1 Tax=Saccoglossus kowalevskii TaxID=10224 RepID=A0ABM0MVK9_SACKO|nr:PREDICTED: ceramide synthase 1-like [Saccoglossus kowalevskii]